MASWVKITTITITLLGVFIVVNSILIFFVAVELGKQNDQIDQLCQFAVYSARSQGVRDGSCGKKASNEYCFFFGDYARGIAVVGEFDGPISYEKTPSLLIWHDLSEEILRSWDKQPILYGRYKKIP